MLIIELLVISGNRLEADGLMWWELVPQTTGWIGNNSSKTMGYFIPDCSTDTKKKIIKKKKLVVMDVSML